jgi:hypothetical protein
MFDKILEAMEMEKEYYFIPKKEYFYDMNNTEIMERLKGVLPKGIRLILSKDKCLYIEEGEYFIMTLIDPALKFKMTGITDEKGEVFSEDEIIEKNDGIIENISIEMSERILTDLLKKCYKT